MAQKFHINKHGVPAPCKAKSGNCPLGNEEQHFNSEEEAQSYADEENEREHGLLPSMNTSINRDDLNSKASDLYKKIRELNASGNTKEIGKLKKELKSLEKQFENTPKKEWSEVRSLASNGNGTPISKSNLVSNMSGTAAQNKYFDDKIKNAGMDSKKLVDSLNNDENIYDKWRVDSETKDSILLKSEDVFGNTRNLNVKKENFVEQVTPKGSSNSYTSNGISTSMSNYVHSLRGEHKSNHIQEIINSSNMDSEKLVKNLNNDEYVSGTWSIEDEDLKRIKLKNTDHLKNESYIEISKGV